MHRVRLLRHHRIKPYIVFDGGPLPAKKGTESERKQKRGENLARGQALAAQGKHAQAREFYVKCVDVTPQMAFQLIKVRDRKPIRILYINDKFYTGAPR
jgi:exonuclease 1